MTTVEFRVFADIGFGWERSDAWGSYTTRAPALRVARAMLKEGAWGYPVKRVEVRRITTRTWVRPVATLTP